MLKNRRNTHVVPVSSIHDMLTILNCLHLLGLLLEYEPHSAIAYSYRRIPFKERRYPVDTPRIDTHNNVCMVSIIEEAALLHT